MEGSTRTHSNDTAPGAEGAAEAGALSLLVMNRAGVFTFPLPAEGEVVVGRGEDCGLMVDDAKVSRRHAAFHLGAEPSLVDLGSRNGTFVGERRAEPGIPIPLAVGDTIMVGSCVLVLQRVNATKAEGFLSQSAFEARLEGELVAAAAAGSELALVRLTFEGPALTQAHKSTVERSHFAADVARAELFERTLREVLRPTDAVGALGPGLYEALLPNTPRDRAEGLAALLGESLTDNGFHVTVTVATYPRSGSSAASLRRSLDGAAPLSSEPKSSAQLDSGVLDRLGPVLERVASGTINVLLLGETGAGKEVMARTLHERSPRGKAPLVCINCAALSESLLESELFGHERGAFTGAVQAKPGLLEAASGGTVFLDEVGEMPLSLQAKLLRVLEQREVLRVGSLRPRPIDVRFISATNRDLEKEVESGRFRQDLYFRLNGFSLTIPPLRERIGEIEPLAKAFLAQASAQAGRAQPPALSAQALALLQRYPWPGNVRELRNVMERAVLLCTGDIITLEHLPAERMASRPSPPVSRQAFPTAPPPDFGDGSAALRGPTARNTEEDRQRILAALEQCAWNQTQAAKVLGISRRTLVTRLSEYDLPRPRKR